MPKEFVKIPLKKIQEGIEHSLEKSSEHLSGAEALISVNSLDDAVVLIGFAIEEFGRAVALREKVEIGSEEVESALFRNHDYKYEKAWSVLPEELRTIYEENLWWGGWWDGWWYEAPQKETISHATRVGATFPKYDEKSEEWKVGIQVDRQKLWTVIKGVREHIRNFEWCAQ